MARKKGDGTKSQNKQDALRRIGPKRVRKALKAIKLVGNLSRYAPTPGQQKSILIALADAVQSVESRFTGSAESVDEFDLP